MGSVFLSQWIRSSVATIARIIEKISFQVFAILHMLSDDLEYLVSLADEAYNMYNNIKLAPEDEVCNIYVLSEVFTYQCVWDYQIIDV